ncbi:MAG TPA: exonuclease SbcCD subunit D [Thiotrichaceae bacterium]|nr:exonuclease SbcCD subunit D [Thiotrichaceae bacterium]
MRILHTSDWHIGRYFHQVALLEDQAFVLEQIVTIAVESKVDVVIIAGDLYDRSIPPSAAVSLVDKILTALCYTHNIPVIIIAGNHDSPERIGFAARQLKAAKLYVMGELDPEFPAIILNDDHGEVAFYSLPYADPVCIRDIFSAESDIDEIRTHDDAMRYLSHKIAAKNNHSRTVAISHCFVAGGSGSESERPLSIGGAEQVSSRHFASFSYTALGHLHGQQSQGGEHIRYSGSPLKYSFSEQNHKKSVTIVDLDGQGAVTTEQVILKPLRDMRTLEGQFDDLLEQAKTDPQPDDYLLIKLTDKVALIDPMAKLRQYYPNILHLERSFYNQNKVSTKAIDIDQNEMAMFTRFYQHYYGEGLDKKQTQYLAKLIDHLKAEE